MKNTYVGEGGLMYCSICKAPLQTVIRLRDGNAKKVKIMCECEKKEYEAQQEAEKRKENENRMKYLQKISLMDERMKSARFDRCIINDSNRRSIEACKRYVNKFGEMYKANQGIVLYGPVGSGKSYLAGAIANELIEQGHYVIMTSFTKILEELGTFSNQDISYIERLNKSELLIIDDLGTERKTDFALEKVYNLIDSRYRAAKPLILTTNLSIDEMMNCEDIRYQRVYDRIFEMCYPMKLDVESWRHKKAVERFEKMKRMME